MFLNAENARRVNNWLWLRLPVIPPVNFYVQRWSITLIKPLFQLLGARKPKYFGVLDLTAGYHQAPLDESSRAY